MKKPKMGIVFSRLPKPNWLPGGLVSAVPWREHWEEMPLLASVGLKVGSNVLPHSSPSSYFFTNRNTPMAQDNWARHHPSSIPASCGDWSKEPRQPTPPAWRRRGQVRVEGAGSPSLCWLTPWVNRLQWRNPCEKLFWLMWQESWLWDWHCRRNGWPARWRARSSVCITAGMVVKHEGIHFFKNKT